MTLAEQLRETYQQAGKEVQKKMDTFWKKHEAKAKRLQADVKKGKITEEDYKKWLSGQVFIGKRWQEKKDDITQVYVQADEKARRIINGTNKNEFVRFANRQGQEIKSHVAGYSFDLYDKHTVERLLRTDPKMLPEWRIDEPKDYTWNAKRVQNSVMQGIIQGESIPQIAKRLEEGLATDNNHKMNLFARTAITGAQNAGRMERLHEATEMGVKVKKKWLATLDDRTRDAHADLDGQEVDIDEKFRVTVKGQTYEIDFPGDPNADPSMTYNCRCTLVFVYPEHQQLPADRIAYETDESGNRKSGTVKEHTYREWKGKEPLARPEGTKAPAKLDINAAVDALPRYKDPRQRDYFDDENWKQNQLKSVDKETADRLEKLYQSFTDADDAKFKEAVVKVSDLKTSQEYVDAKKLKEMLESYDGQTITGAATDGDNGIRVFKVDGEYIVIDGNHRANAALLQGQDDINVMVYDVSAKEPTANLSESVLKKIDAYIEGEGNSFEKSEVEEIKRNMTETKQALYRVEDLSWMGENLEIGDSFTFDKDLKSFTQDFKGLREVVAEGDDAGLYEGTLAIFETVDETKHLDVSGISRNHAEEKESLVGGKFEVVDEHEGPQINGYDTWIFEIRQIPDDEKRKR